MSRGTSLKSNDKVKSTALMDVQYVAITWGRWECSYVSLNKIEWKKAIDRWTKKEKKSYYNLENNSGQRNKT